ncbi:MAG: SH3 domain-containing protein [Treponema sp.]|nr:SH3 domain-containing protein [Treponema sp.]
MNKVIKHLLIMALFAAMGAQIFAAGKKQYVSVASVDVKAKASQFSSSVGTVKYADEVIVIQADKSWSKIELPGGKSGWLPNSSLSAKKIVVKLDGKKKSSATASELALAGKGFDSNFENTFEKTNDVSFAPVDKIETFSASEKDAVDFLKEGQLFVGGEE